MTSMIQVRNVPVDVHRTLKARAAQAGMTLSEFLLRELMLVARRPTLEDIQRRIMERPVPSLSEDSVTAVRAEREGRR
ncbi:MAG: hypothetical protein KAI47_10615 [Deltaproteobacteria bacterium]|nr:hypothetical protein [Deltaproteobacteria bacterium]